MQADIEEVFSFPRQGLLIMKNNFICSLFKIITGRLRGILGVGASSVYKGFFGRSPPAALWSSATRCGMQEGALTQLLYTMDILSPISPPPPAFVR